jgi:hypothetical protein
VEAVGAGGGVGDVVALGGEEVGDDEGDIGFVLQRAGFANSSYCSGRAAGRRRVESRRPLVGDLGR